MTYMNLIDVCDFQGGSQPPKDKWITQYKDGYIRMLQIRDFTQKRDERDYVEVSNRIKICKKDDVLIARYGASVGKILTGLEGAYNVAIIKSIPSKLIDKRYLYYYFNSSYFQNFLKNVGSRAAQAGFNKEDLREAKIFVPKIEHQRNIVSILNKSKNLIERRKNQIEQLDLLVKSKFIEMFGDPVLNPKGWETHILQECCTKITDGTHDTPQRLQEGRLLITGKNIRKDKIDLTDIEYVSEEDHQIIYKRCNPEYGDVLYTNIGANYGTAIFNSLDYEFSMKNVALLKPEKSKINSIYLWYYLNLRRDYILEQNKTGGAQTFMSLSTIKKLNIVVPELEIQNEYEMFIKEVDKLKFEMEKSLKELEDNFNSLMNKAFKGELF
ncbi:restriction endonuclease subunit S [Clostridium perfringens]